MGNQAWPKALQRFPAELCNLHGCLQHAEVQEGTEGGRGPGSVVPPLTAPAPATRQVPAADPMRTLLTQPLNLDEHRREEAGNHEVQRIVRHHLSCAKLRAAAHFNATCSEVDPLPEEELWVGQLLVLCLPLA